MTSNRFFSLRPSIMVPLALLLFVLSGCGGESGETAESTESGKSAGQLFWKVSGNGLSEPSYLLGTYHLLGNDFWEARPSVMKAFDACKGVLTETELVEGAEAQIQAKSIMSDTTLPEMMSPEDWELVTKEYTALTGMPPIGIDSC
ncbi:MAG: TraB/GumN family protein [Bacteroidota bacterium]